MQRRKQRQTSLLPFPPSLVFGCCSGDPLDAASLGSCADSGCYISVCYDTESLEHPNLCNVMMSWGCVQTESGQGYNLDCSLFERLVEGGFPVATLEEQRRMRPSIACLIRDTIYPNLRVDPCPITLPPPPAPSPPPPSSLISSGTPSIPSCGWCCCLV